MIDPYSRIPGESSPNTCTLRSRCTLFFFGHLLGRGARASAFSGVQLRRFGGGEECSNLLGHVSRAPETPERLRTRCRRVLRANRRSSAHLRVQWIWRGDIEKERKLQSRRTARKHTWNDVAGRQKHHLRWVGPVRARARQKRCLHSFVLCERVRRE